MMSNAFSKYMLIPVFFVLICAMPTFAQTSTQLIDRRILPLTEPTYPAYTELDVRKTEPPPRFEVTAPKNAPNVMIILIDDLGFGATSPFGGPIPTPALDRLSQSGLRYNNFHTTALSDLLTSEEFIATPFCKAGAVPYPEKQSAWR